MSSEREDFAELRKLLALKRHEVPPPGYFDRFSCQVMDRIKTGQPISDTFWSRWLEQWKALSSFEVKPALAAGFGAVVCAVLGAAFFISDPGIENHTPSVAAFGPDSLVTENYMATTAPGIFPAHSRAALPSTGGMLSPGEQPSLFRSLPSIQVQPASFSPNRQ